MIDTDSLANRGFAVAPGLIGPDQCRALAALWPDKARFRSHVIMQRHGYGQGEYQYFTYPLPGPVETLRQALYPELASDRQPLERAARPGQALPAHAGGLAAAVPPGRPEAADAAAAALRAGRLQLPAPRPLRRAGVPAAGDRAAERSRARFQRRRVHAGRAAAAHAVARRGRAAQPGRRGDLRGERTAGEGKPRFSPHGDAPRRRRACATASDSRSASFSTTRPSVTGASGRGADTAETSPRDGATREASRALWACAGTAFQSAAAATMRQQKCASVPRTLSAPPSPDLLNSSGPPISMLKRQNRT